MLIAFGDRLEKEWLERELGAEDALDALKALQELADERAFLRDTRQEGPYVEVQTTSLPER